MKGPNSLKTSKYLSCTYQMFSCGARWLSGRVSDSGARGPGFETYRRRVVSLSKNFTPRKYWWLRPDMTEKLLTGTLSLNTNKQNVFLGVGGGLLFFCGGWGNSGDLSIHDLRPSFECYRD